HGYRSGVVVRFGALLLGAVVPRVPALVGESDQGLGVQPLRGFGAHDLLPPVGWAGGMVGGGPAGGWRRGQNPGCPIGGGEAGPTRWRSGPSSCAVSASRTGRGTATPTVTSASCRHRLALTGSVGPGWSRSR